MKKLLYIFLAIVILFTLGMCAETEDTPQSEMESEAATLETKQTENESEKENQTPATASTKAPTTTTKAPAQEFVGEIVYTTQTGKKYHSRKSCPGLSNAKKNIRIHIIPSNGQGFGSLF